MEKLTKQQLDAFREQLSTRQKEIQGDLSRIDQEIESISTDQALERGSLGNHFADDGSNVMEAERIGTIGEDMRDVLRQIEDALSRLDDGTFGTCQRCHKAINPERLEAFPYVEFCIECQSILERERALYGTTVR